MKIEQYYERKDPKNVMSIIIYRGLQFETNLKLDCIKKIAKKVNAGLEDKIWVIAVIDRKTRFRISLEDAATATFSKFVYEVMNWEANINHWN